MSEKQYLFKFFGMQKSILPVLHLQYTLFTYIKANERQKLQERKNVFQIFTFSFCSDLNSISFSWSLFSLASSFSRCLAAIFPSSASTSSCWARHCCSYNAYTQRHIQTRKYMTGTNKNQVIGHHQRSEKNQSQEDDQLGPTVTVLEMTTAFHTLWEITTGSIKPLNQKLEGHYAIDMLDVLGISRFVILLLLN